MNKWTGIGNLTKDPEITTTSSGISVARFTLAIQEKFAREDGTKEVDFINCVAWRVLADNLYKFCKKGDKIAVVGKIKPRSYEAEDGSKRYVTEVIAEEIEFVNTKRAENNGTNNGIKESQTHNFTPIDDDNLPF